MDDVRKLLARKLFRLRVHEAKGTDYQRLLEAVLKYRDPEFTVIKPHGNVGDRKNDGYSPASGIYYQVYAPERPNEARKATEAATKAKDDFEGLREHWDEKRPLSEYRFAFNDAFRGSPPPLELAIAEIEASSGVPGRSFLAQHLEDEALQLESDQLMDVVQAPIPSGDVLDEVDFGVLREVIQYVLANKTPLAYGSSLVAPDFDEKIKFNGLSEVVAPLLQVGSYQSEAIDDYFSQNSDFAKQQVRDHLAAMYAVAREEVLAYDGDVEDTGDFIFFKLLDRVTPSDAVAPATRAFAQDAALVVLAYYFEACDVFEDPNAAS